MKIRNNQIGIRTRDLLACSVVPQPTGPPRALPTLCIMHVYMCVLCVCV